MTSYDELPAKWSCGACTFENHKATTRCTVCQVGERPLIYANALNEKQNKKNNKLYFQYGNEVCYF